MSLAVIYTRANLGMKTPLVEVEVHLSSGLPKVTIVGLPETAVKESRDRVRSAIINSRFEFPSKRITINLAPADLPKEGGRYDLAIALGILAASHQISHKLLAQYEFAGELTLSGELRVFPGTLPMILAASASHRSVVVPIGASYFCAPQTPVYEAPHLLAVCQHVCERNMLPLQSQTPRENADPLHHLTPDLNEVFGQHQAKRALEIAAAGGHSVLMQGPPGSGKTMLATRLNGLLPDLTPNEAIEVASIYSLSGKNIQRSHDWERPFRAPHHSASGAAIIGGGRVPKPGEISLAHCGVLFLDELTEFSTSCLEALREPLEAHCVTIARAAYSIEYPAKFQLIAAMNPCPCGYWHDTSKTCICTPNEIIRYQKRLSGPFLDRIDLMVQLTAVDVKLLIQANTRAAESSVDIKKRVCAARAVQQERAHKLNSQLKDNDLNAWVPQEEHVYMEKIIQRFQLSARAYHRILKVARTIADLAGSCTIKRMHIQEACLLRSNVSLPILE